jgi:hypothetical protein
VTDAVTEEITAWQDRPLDPVWPILYIDALWVKIRDGAVANRPVYLAVGVDLDGRKHVLGLWIGPGEGEGARFWMSGSAARRGRRRGLIARCRTQSARTRSTSASSTLPPTARAGPCTAAACSSLVIGPTTAGASFRTAARLGCSSARA